MKGRVFAFGPGDALAGSLTLPRGDCRLGAVIWGMGVAEMQVARRLARQGIAALQIRIDDGNRNEDFDRRNRQYDAHGAEYCSAAMDELTGHTGLTRFVLMGNCATANISFAAACTDERVAGLVLTNPHFHATENLVEKIRWALARRLVGSAPAMSAASAPGAPAATAGASVAPSTRELARRLWRRASGRRPRHCRDVVLPADLGARLETLAARGVRLLIVYAGGEAGHEYLHRKHGPAVERLVRAEALELARVGQSHVFSLDAAAATELNERVDAWIARRFPACTQAADAALA